MDEDQAQNSRERKQSSGDLHSRLKTRKLLGVGETDDGDVHRSKLSQILGHSDRLYARLPRGTKAWLFFTAVAFSCIGIITVCQPNLLLGSAGHCASQLAPRLYGGCLITTSIGLWLAWRSQDRKIVQFSLVGIIVHSCVQLFVTFAHLQSDGPNSNWRLLLLWLSAQIVASLIGAYLLQAMGSHRRCSKLVANQSQAEANTGQQQFEEVD